ncbi:MAG: TonB terminal [Pseudomonadota bacterium]
MSGGWRSFAASLGVHAGFALTALVLSGWQAAPRALPAAQEVIMVEMAGPAVQASRMPQKAERAPPPPQGTSAPAPPPEPPPPRESELAVKTPEAPKKQGDAKAPRDSRRREELERELRRARLMDELRDAPVGREDRAASAPDARAGDGAAASNGVADAELARWTEAARLAVQPNWTPIRAYCRPGRVARVSIPVDGRGAKSGRPRIAQPSGDAGFDAAALRAVEATTRLPAPPARYASGVTGVVEFRAGECP